MSDEIIIKPKLLVTGGTGNIGCYAVPFLSSTYDITVVTRNVAKAELNLGSRIHLLSSLSQLDNLNPYDAVINLAGESLFDKRWCEQQKGIIEQSRWQTTQVLVNLFKNSSTPPSVFLSGSAIGYYGRQGSQQVDENCDQPYDEFSHQLCKKWEQIALQAQSEQTRVCLLRTGIVLAKNGGALQSMLPPFKVGLGGPIGKGQQYLSWIHIHDLLTALQFLLENAECQGAVNLTAPNPVTNKTFAKTLGKTLRRPVLFNTPTSLLTILLGESAELLIYGQKVLPSKLQQSGFEFKYHELESALASLKL